MKHQLPPMDRTETIWGVAFLLAQYLLIPIAVSLMVVLFHLTLSNAELNAACYFANFVCAVLIFHNYWIRSIKELSSKWLTVLRNAGKYFLIYYSATILINLLIFRLDPEFSNANDNNIAAMSADSKLLIGICVVVLVPPVEEIFYRGIVFGKLYAKSPLLGYLVSILIFASIHVIAYIGSVPTMRLLLSLLQYIPAGYCLARAYARSGSLFTPMLIHATINLIAVLLM